MTLRALGLALGEGPVQLHEGCSAEGPHDSGTPRGPQSCVQDEDLDVGTGHACFRPAGRRGAGGRSRRWAVDGYSFRTRS